MKRQCFPRSLFTASILTAVASLGAAAPLLASPVPTATKLYIAPGGSIHTGKVVNLKAWVATDGVSVTHGSVLFCNAAAPHCSDVNVLAQVQLRSSGTAEINLIPPRGTRKVQAVFQGTNLAAPSKSDIQTILVTGSEIPTTTAITAEGTPDSYTLISTVSSVIPSLSGTVNFVDATNANTVIGQATLAPQTLTFVDQHSPLPAATYLPQVNADFNGDGRLDQAVLNQNPDTGTTSGITILLGKGDGTFTLGSNISAENTTLVQVGDFNNDDLPDLLLVDRPDGTMSVLLGNGDGTFQTAIPLPAVPALVYPAYAVVGDFNEDGNQDVLISLAYTGQLQTFLGNGDGTFVQLPITSSVGAIASQIALGDFNADGIEDLAVGFAPGPPQILLGNGDGTFTPGPALSISCSQACAGVVAADFNQDGKTDLAVTDSSTSFNLSNLYILSGNGNGTFGLLTTLTGGSFNSITLGLGDFNGDGKADLITGNRYGMETNAYLGSGDGYFPYTVLVGETNAPFTLGDFNNDGQTDVDLVPTAITLTEVQAIAYLTNVSFQGTTTHEVHAEYGGNATHKPSKSGQYALWSVGETSSETSARRVKQ